MDNYEKNVRTKVFTTKEEISLLKQIREDKQSLCTCKSCTINRLKSLAYQVACKKKKSYPKSWDKNRQVEQKWLEKFEKRHKDEISKFPFVCKEDISQTLTGKKIRKHSGLTNDDERLLLKQLQEMETQHGCRCKNCLMKEARIRAYKLACDLHEDCPESWNTQGKADYRWLESFTERHKDEISKFPSICSLTILNIDEEESLLRQLQDMEIQRDCRCKNCLMKEAQNLAYEIARILFKYYPESWNIQRKADYGWLKGFIERHKDEISKFPSVCSLTVLTIDDEQLLLTYLQEVKIRRGCKCKNCFLKEVQEDLACKITRDLHKYYPEWSNNKNAIYKWLRRFEEKHKIKISKFPTVCKKYISQTITRKEISISPILTIDDERLLLTSRLEGQFQSIFTTQDELLILTQLQEMETRHSCRCKNCLMEEARILAYKLACDLHIDCPESWNIEGKADYGWLQSFTEKHKDEISKFPSVCNFTVLTIDQEQSLLRQLQDIKVQRDCKCKNCLIEEARILAYKLACDLHIDCPESWNTEGKADYGWLQSFTERHKDEISKFPSVCNFTVLTIDQEQSLLRQLQDIKVQRDCRCKNCLMEEARILAYKLACDLHIDCPESWSTEGKADYEWLQSFTERHKDEISKFPSVCNFTVLTIDQEQSLLRQLQDIKIQCDCRCKNCLMEEAQILAYKLVCDLHIDYPESWNTEGKAEYGWLKGFIERHKDEISKFPSICSLIVLTIDQEQSLLRQLQVIKTQRDCKCKNCIMKKARIEAYKFACVLQLNFPESWNTEGKADYGWLKGFTERHKDEISKLPSICSLTVLTIDQEQLLLRQLQDIRFQRDCRCKNCLIKEMRILAYKLACELHIDCPKSWNEEGKANYGWLESFTERYKDEISKFSSICSLTVLTIDQEQSLLRQLQNIKIQRDCRCKNCLMEEARILAYKLACDLHIDCPESWNTEGKADYGWLKGFTERHKDKISKFPSICSLTILTIDEEQSLLRQLQDIKIQRDCRCKNCLMKEAQNLAYEIACILLKDYPESWNTQRKADYGWLKGFTERNKDEISKFPSTCSLKILTIDEERSLLRQLQDIKIQRDCRCKNCLLEEAQNLAYEIACILFKDYPESWNIQQKADYGWLEGFIERHKDEISKFLSVCKKDMPQASTSRKTWPKRVLTTKEEQVLLMQLGEMETKHGCKCKKCLKEEVRILAYKLASDLKRRYPKSWNIEGKADLVWLKRFIIRHRDKISKFPTVCNRTVLTNDDEQLLLNHLQEVKARRGCKCKNCFEKEVPLLAHKITCDLNENFPEWKKRKNAIYKWLRRFEEKHKIEISDYPTVCKEDLPQVLTNKKTRSKPVLTIEEERVLLMQSWGMETQHSCKCKKCLKKEVRILVYELACNLKRDYPKSWSTEGKADVVWLKRFIMRHRDVISKLPTVCNRTVLTNDDEQSLLSYLQEVKARRGCKCKNCFEKEVPLLAHKITCDLNENFPEWKNGKYALYKWLRRFEERHKIEISEFPTACNRTVLTNDDEQLLLNHLQEVKARRGCKCENCFKKEVPLLAYKITCDLNKHFPEWKKEENAMYKWLRRFEDKHEIEISEFPTVCKGTVLTNYDEQLLLNHLQEVKARRGCTCENCLKKEVPLLAYKITCDLHKNFPEWKEEENAMYKWLRRFEDRHKIEISEFPTVCNRKILTNDDEQLLLNYLQKVKARHDCKCKTCFEKEVPLLAHKITCDLNENYPEWKREKYALYKWLRRFEERHKIEISEFPTVCKRTVLTNDDEQLLLNHLQEVKARRGCKCKKCFVKEVKQDLLCKIHHDLKKNFPEWKRGENALYKWLRRFEERHKIEISEFPTFCNRTVLTNDDEQLLLNYLQEVKDRHGCKCKNCFEKEVPLLAHKITCDLNENFSEWKREKNALYKWLRHFEERHKIEISEFPTVCKKDLPQASTSSNPRSKVLTIQEEQWLLMQLRKKNTQHGCICKKCVKKEVRIRAYNLACNLNRDYPKSWITKGKAELVWLTGFIVRHRDEISKFPTVCNRTVLTKDDEQLLLSYLQEVKARRGCKCKNCFAKDVPLLAYKITCDLNKNFPEWKLEENALYKWLRRFEKRHKIEISEFPTVCEADY